MENYSPKLKNKDIKKRTYDFALDVIKFIDTLDKKDFSVAIVAKQVIRSTTSIGANIVEAQACSTKKDFTHFITHALKSANETKFWIGLLRDANKADKNQTQNLLDEATEIANILGASVVKLRSR